MTVEIQGDLLALDGTLRRRIQSQAEALQARFPSHHIDLLARLGEEFDHLSGHRVRCELRTSVAARQQIVVREARKNAEEAIAAAFGEIKKKFRQMSLRLNRRPAADISLPMGSGSIRPASAATRVSPRLG
jgi:ribosome-associated translation inhibitor RaiA